jgi:hypothetical protein
LIKDAFYLHFDVGEEVLEKSGVEFRVEEEERENGGEVLYRRRNTHRIARKRILRCYRPR